MSDGSATGQPVPPAAAAARASSRAYSGYVIALLCAANAFNFGDRILIGIVQEQLRREFHLSDFDIGLLGGTAFATLYIFMGLPIARLADRRDRVTILSVALALWSLMTLLGGRAGSYTQLFVTRLGVSIGEAGCAPPSHSLLSDYFPPERRTSALSLYAMGAPLGSFMMAIVGGAIAQRLGWRHAFIAAGAGGLVLALLIRLTLREPRRGGGPVERASFMETIGTLLSKRSYIHTCIGGGISGFGATFILQYLVSFLIRSHGVPLPRAAMVVGICSGIATALGQLVLGIVAERRSRRDVRQLQFVTATALIVSVFFYIAAFTAPTMAIVVPALFVAFALQGSYLGQAFAIMQGVAPHHMRATAAAIFMFVNSALAFGLGPPVFGAISDGIARWLLPAGVDGAFCLAHLADPVCASASADGLRGALLVASLAPVWSAAHFLLSARTFARDRVPT